MNYRHAFHAGNFADVLKHVILARILVHLRAKETPFRVIDTHAGAGLYDLAGEKAERTGEWRFGIGRLLDRDRPAIVEKLLEPYLSCLAAVRTARGKTIYPGSPEIARRLLREQDRLIAFETHERDCLALRAALAQDRRAKVLSLDGYIGLFANIPPKERRGLVLIDPPYEHPEEFETVVNALLRAHAKWETGIYAVWYPLIDSNLVTKFHARIARSKIEKVLVAELRVVESGEQRGMGACGLILVNPPWKLESELATILPYLADRLARQGKGAWRLASLEAKESLDKTDRTSSRRLAPQGSGHG